MEHPHYMRNAMKVRTGSLCRLKVKTGGKLNVVPAKGRTERELSLLACHSFVLRA
jgi:hypothetical protein